MIDLDVRARKTLGKELSQLTDAQVLRLLESLVREKAAQMPANPGKRRLYYLSAEFLLGRLLTTNLINLGIYDEVREQLAAAGHDMCRVEECEVEPSLGNGGLGRLAACFLDSMATLGLPGDGVGLNYHYGLFHQRFVDGQQTALPDEWLAEQGWLHEEPTSFTVPFADFSVTSRLYSVDVLGYGRTTKNRLRLFDLVGVDDALVPQDSIAFDKTALEKNLTLFLYPDDSDEAGRLLRVYQQYFMVSNAAQLLVAEALERGSNLHDLADYAVVQINDPHPTMVIPELIRLLGERGIGFDEAVQIVRDTCAYTNHTILAEALECWPLGFIERVAPQLVPIIQQLDAFVRGQYEDDFVQVIDKWQNVHMANIDIHFSHSVNGVAALHTKILEDSELAPFYKIYPEKFNNKTNGITFRRWMVECNPGLNKLVSGKIGEGWKTDAEQLEQLLPLADDPAFLAQLDQVKRANKQTFATWLAAHQGTVVDPDSVFDVQSKRLHEYKRQQLNLLWAIRKYQRLQMLEADEQPKHKVTVIFGAKAAPAYTIAKDIIHAIICLGKVIEADPVASKYLQVVMIENYNVTAAQHLIPAADISEQISLASKEASGTSNMKFMLNGAVTLGTMDGANVEIADLVGEDNIYTFGESSDEVIARYKRGDYNPRNYYEKDEELAAAVDFLTSDAMLAQGDATNLNRLHDELLNKDWFMTFPDFADYCATKAQVLKDYEDREAWQRKALVNISKAGYFSSDRTIAQYEKDIWHLR